MRCARTSVASKSYRHLDDLEIAGAELVHCPILRFSYDFWRVREDGECMRLPSKLRDRAMATNIVEPVGAVSTPDITACVFMSYRLNILRRSNHAGFE